MATHMTKLTVAQLRDIARRASRAINDTLHHEELMKELLAIERLCNTTIGQSHMGCADSQVLLETEEYVIDYTVEDEPDRIFTMSNTYPSIQEAWEAVGTAAKYRAGKPLVSVSVRRI